MHIEKNNIFRSLILVAFVTFIVVMTALFTSSKSSESEAATPNYVIQGKGYGHGVGLSMSGVKTLANSGSDYVTILKKYYTGVTVQSRADLMPAKIRVGLQSTTGSVTVTANGSFNVYDATTGEKLGDALSGQVASVTYSGGSYQLLMPSSSLPKTYLHPIKFSGSSSSTIMQITSLVRMSGSVNMNQYRGSVIAQYSTNSNTLWAINELPVDEYIYGLAEEPNDWPTEGHRTLAVASRTYAVEKVRNPNTGFKKDNYDMCASSCQYYLGYLAERPNLRIAADATKNVLITHPSAPYSVIIAAYSASSGGYTESNEDYWLGQSPIPYLRAVPDPASDTTLWINNYTQSDLQQKLDSSSKTSVPGDLIGFEITKKSVSGRTVYLNIVGTEGIHKDVRGYDLQSVLGLRSNLFEIITSGTYPRYAGTNRYDTNRLISSSNFTKSEVVILAAGTNFPDALSGGPLAKVYSAPIILTEPTKLTTSALNEIDRLGAKRVYILGGTSAISSTVEQTLKNNGKIVSRIYGQDRYSTSVKIAELIYPANGDTVFLATGVQFPDSLSAVPAAYKEGAPILLTPKDKLPDAVRKYITSKKITDVVVVGGNAALSTNIEAELRSMGVSSMRIAGANRYDTSNKIAQKYFSQPGSVYISSGENYPDALSIGPVAGKLTSPVLLTPKTKLAPEIEDYLIDNSTSINELRITGGTSAVGHEVDSQIASILE